MPSSSSRTWTSLIALLALLALIMFPATTHALSLADVAAYGHPAPPAKAAVESSKIAERRSFALKKANKSRTFHGGVKQPREVQLKRRTGRGVRRLVVGDDGHY